MTFEVLDPTHGTDAQPFALAERLDSLEGAVIGIVSNGKQGTRRFFDALAKELIENYGVADVVKETKSNYSAPADPDIMDRAKQWNALVSGIGD
ncbi:MAG: hypothetical protein ACI8TP_001212 [Acidimicrobiales bacterium]|jgi:hypothetical protein